MEVLKKIGIKLFLLFSVIIFLIPGSSSFFLNGLPVTGKLENLLIIFIPLILINCFHVFKIVSQDLIELQSQFKRDFLIN